MKDIIILCFALFGGIALLSSQEVKLSGVVVDTTQKPSPYASVIFTASQSEEQKQLGVITDENGQYKIALPALNFEVTVNAVGGNATTLLLDLREKRGKVKAPAFIIEREVALTGVEVSSERILVEDQVEKTVYHVSRDKAAQGTFLNSVIANLPLVQSDGNEISIRGDTNVALLVNGQPNSLTENLGQFPANMVDKIEVITSPSARYQAQGSAGILNIVLKKATEDMSRKSVEFFSGTPLTAGVNANFSKGGKKGEWYMNMGLGHLEPEGKTLIETSTPGQSILATSQEEKRKYESAYYLFTLGGRKSLGKAHRLEGSVTVRQTEGDRLNSVLYDDTATSTQLLQSTRTERLNLSRDLLSANLGHTLNFNEKGHSLTTHYEWNQRDNDERSEIDIFQILPTYEPGDNDLTFNDGRRTTTAFSMDYTLPLKNKAKLSVGFRNDLLKLENDFGLSRVIEEETIVVDAFTDQTEYRQNVSAVYAEYSKSYEKSSLRLGFRTEWSDIDIRSYGNAFGDKKNYVNGFPSLRYLLNIDKKNRIQIAVTRRINRPGGFWFIPYYSFSDSRNAFVGNRDLNPSYATSFDVRMRMIRSEKIRFYPGLFFRRTTDEYELYVERQSYLVNGVEENVLTSTLANIGDYDAYGATFGILYRPVKKSRIRANFMFNRFDQEGSYRGVSFSGKGLMFLAQMVASMPLSNSINLQWQNFYRGPVQAGQYNQLGVYYSNFNFNKSIFQGKGALGITVNDIFNSNFRRVRTRGDDFVRELEFQSRIRSIQFSVTYQINQKRYQGNKGVQDDGGGIEF